ncbi:hypothetical protein ACHAWF_007284 [Thalassiosira exigua]
MVPHHSLFLLSACLSHFPTTNSFVPQITQLPISRIHTDGTEVTKSSRSPTHLSMAGFGASATKKQKKKGGAAVPKLKAKSQWDRYADLKKSQKVTVGVRIKGDGDSSNEWMEVGRVRSEGDEYTEVAIARQRALIAEHSKRLFMVQIPANSVLEWGYLDGDENGEWVAVDKSKGDDAPSGIEKKIGFEGLPDKATGFYCYYHNGRVVEREEEGGGKRAEFK